jgi:hypothetical protein
MSIKVKQSATPSGKDWWRWSVWLEGDGDELAEVESVKYTLHPTFPNPVRVVKTRATKFRLSSAGWGEFEVYVEIRRKDGRVVERKHWLKLEEELSDRLQRKVKKGVKKILDGEAERGGGAGAERRSVFISSSAADMPLARVLGEALQEKGVEVLAADESSSLPWNVFLNSQMKRADNAVFILSDSASPWVTQEIKAAHNHRLPVTLLVIAGRPVEIPPDLDGPGVARLKIKPVPAEAGDEEVREEMRAVAKRLVGKIFPNPA